MDKALAYSTEGRGSIPVIIQHKFLSGFYKIVGPLYDGIMQKCRNIKYFMIIILSINCGSVKVIKILIIKKNITLMLMTP